MKKWSFVFFVIMLSALIWYQSYTFPISETFKMNSYQWNLMIQTKLINQYHMLFNSTFVQHFGTGFKLLLRYFKDERMSAKIKPYLPRLLKSKRVFKMIDAVDSLVWKIWNWIQYHWDTLTMSVLGTLSSNSTSES
jgi:hypothetical protein